MKTLLYYAILIIVGFVTLFAMSTVEVLVWKNPPGFVFPLNCLVAVYAASAIRKPLKRGLEIK